MARWGCGALGRAGRKWSSQESPSGAASCLLCSHRRRPLPPTQAAAPRRPPASGDLLPLFFTLQPPPQLPASEWAAVKLELLVEDAARLLNELTGSSAREGDTMRPPAMPLTALTHAQVGGYSAAGMAAATKRCAARPGGARSAIHQPPSRAGAGVCFPPQGELAGNCGRRYSPVLIAVHCLSSATSCSDARVCLLTAYHLPCRQARCCRL